ncbi:hypothetical protein [Halobaculum sp. P14]|uniref:hypothetical protein n=1 Tax=Halobaculum sp. P14 TaxID=3421638 RepID=UPI003EBFA90F
MSSVRSAGKRLVPDHLTNVGSEPDRGSDLKCRTCRRWITVGPDGTEFGHARRGGRAGGELDGRCPHRPESVEPTYSGTVPESAKSVSFDERGQFCSPEVSE